VFSLSLYRHPFQYTLFSSRFTLIINNNTLGQKSFIDVFLPSHPLLSVTWDLRPIHVLVSYQNLISIIMSLLALMVLLFHFFSHTPVPPTHVFLWKNFKLNVFLQYFFSNETQNQIETPLVVREPQKCRVKKTGDTVWTFEWIFECFAFVIKFVMSPSVDITRTVFKLSKYSVHTSWCSILSVTVLCPVKNP
jgi:hypothetical protein